MPPFTEIKKNRRIDMYIFLIDTCGQISFIYKRVDIIYFPHWFLFGLLD